MVLKKSHGKSRIALCDTRALEWMLDEETSDVIVLQILEMREQSLAYKWIVEIIKEEDYEEVTNGIHEKTGNN